jgi:hypothetical protein
MDTHIYNIVIRVLLYEDGGEWCAHALELDLVGYGKTIKRAMSQLSDLISAQISFARFKNDDSLLPFPAPKELFERWETAHAATLKREILKETSAKMSIQAVCIDISDEVNKPSKARFQVMESSCA